MTMELEDGLVMVSARAYDDARLLACGAVMIYPFNMQGNISMTPSCLNPQLIIPMMASRIIRYGWKKDGKGVLPFSDPDHLRLRVNMTTRFSQDNGRVWSDAK